MALLGEGGALHPDHVRFLHAQQMPPAEGEHEAPDLGRVHLLHAQKVLLAESEGGDPDLDHARLLHAQFVQVLHPPQAHVEYFLVPRVCICMSTI